MIILSLMLALLQADPAAPARAAPVNAYDWNPGALIQDGSARCGDCRRRTQRFMVDYEMHTGYHLRPLSEPAGRVSIVFANPRIMRRFDDYLREDPDIIGGEPLGYCTCSGVRYEVPGTDIVIFRVDYADLFRR